VPSFLHSFVKEKAAARPGAEFVCSQSLHSAQVAVSKLDGDVQYFTVFAASWTSCHHIHHFVETLKIHCVISRLTCSLAESVHRQRLGKISKGPKRLQDSGKRQTARTGSTRVLLRGMQRFPTSFKLAQVNFNTVLQRVFLAARRFFDFRQLRAELA
jgi:hypothetical protein